MNKQSNMVLNFDFDIYTFKIKVFWDAKPCGLRDSNISEKCTSSSESSLLILKMRWYISHKTMVPVHQTKS
jgi:hypothetical protein